VYATKIMTEAIIVKAAKKSLKRQDSGQMKLKVLVRQLSAEQSDWSTKDVKKVLKGSNKFTVTGKLVALNSSSRKRSVDSPTQQAGVPEEKDRLHKKTKTAATTTSSGFTDHEPAAVTKEGAETWRREHKIVVLSANDDGDANETLQGSADLFPWDTFDGVVVSTTKIHRNLIRQCVEVNKFHRPSPIQAQAWPILSAGRDMVGIAETGSGKVRDSVSITCKNRSRPASHPQFVATRSH
jgi:hypothetical protein